MKLGIATEITSLPFIAAPKRRIPTIPNDPTPAASRAKREDVATSRGPKKARSSSRRRQPS